jgi:UDP-N-acetyl-D-galactosamine dehydrogenase
MDLSASKIAVIGLGYVGLPLAVEFGKIRPTLGYDLSEPRINQLTNGIDNTLEVSGAELQEARELTFSANANDLDSCQIFIVTVPTPIDKARRPDLSAIEAATRVVGQAIKPGSIIIFESTVYPGCTEEVCVPVLEEISGLRYNTDFFCGYSPERINPGDKVNTLTKIIKVTSGSTEDAGAAIDSLYKQIIKAGTFKASSIRVAEAAKVIENTQRDLNIALVNELAVIFDRLDIDTLDVLEAAGSKWNFLPFRPGIVGGHCIGVDPYYLTHKAEQVGYNPQVILAGRRINDNMGRFVARKLVQKMLLNNIDVTASKVGILGITFKENCPDIRNSKVVDIITELQAWNLSVEVIDPWADSKEVSDVYGLSLSALDRGCQWDALVVAVGHDEFRCLSAKDLKSFCRGENPVLIDLKSLYDRNDLCEQGFSVFRL